MKFRKIETDFCDRCKVQFEVPSKDAVRRFRNLCQEHREEAEALQRRKDVVASWAETYWRELEPMAKAMMALAYNQNLAVGQQQMAGLQNAYHRGGVLGGIAAGGQWPP